MDFDGFYGAFHGWALGDDRRRVRALVQHLRRRAIAIQHHGQEHVEEHQQGETDVDHLDFTRFYVVLLDFA